MREDHLLLCQKTIRRHLRYENLRMVDRPLPVLFAEAYLTCVVWPLPFYS